MELIKQYKKSKKEALRLRKEKDKKVEALDKEDSEIRNKFWDKEKRLRDQKDKEQSNLSKKRDSLNKEYEPIFEENHKPIAQIKRVIEFLQLKKDRELTFDDVRTYRDRYLEDLGYLFEDDLLKIKVFISENDKPKNKYSLSVIGKSIFGHELVGFPYSYGLSINDNWGSLKIAIKDAPTIEELKEYLKKNKDKILSKCKIENYEKIKAEYLEICEKYKIEDFDEFREYEEFRCLDEYQKKIVMESYEKDHPGANKQKDPYEYYYDNKERFNFKVLKAYNL